MNSKSHLSVLLKKNFLLWKRNIVCSMLEIFFPVILCSFLFLIRSLTDSYEVSQRQYITPQLQVLNNPNIQQELKDLAQMPYLMFGNTPVKSNIPSQVYNQYSNQDSNFNLSDILQIRNCVSNTRSGEPMSSEETGFRNGNIAITPQNDFTEKLADQLNKEFFSGQDKYMVKFYETQQQIDDYITGTSYQEDICFGISFEKFGTGQDNGIQSNKWAYTLYFNITGNPSTYEVPSLQEQQTLLFKPQNIDAYFTPWVQNGFLQLQNWIDNLIFQEEHTGGDKNQINVQVSSFQTPQYLMDPIVPVLEGQMATYLVFPMIIIYLRMTYSLIIEKEKKIKEGMKIMGMSNTSFYLSWIIQYLISYFLAAVLVSLVLKFTIFPNSEYEIILLWYWLYCVSLISQSLFVQSFFTQAKIGNVVGMVLYLFFYVPNFIIGGGEIDISTKRIFSIFSQVALIQSSDCFLLIEERSEGITWSNMDRNINQYSVSISMYMMAINIIIFGSLALYFDQVIPNEFGKKKHPLFCCIRNNNKSTGIKQQSDQENQKKKQSEFIEEVNNILKQKETDNEVLKLENLTKKYPNGKIAVNGLNFTMYKDQISCFLGHNGSGKTSTISMLTGMQEITEGNAKAFGYDVTTEMDELRKITGVCPQHDILFDNLTCKEHLELFAAFKGLPSNQIDEQVKILLQDVNLEFKKDEYAKSLSGGQKRRLSIAIAFIGNSKIVYLDEPTSGCDTSARRYIWEMLRKYKQGRIIVLTSHFMDECEVLGDRIAIIGKGQLLCLGSPIYLKSQFGIGYNLTIIKEEPITDSKPIKDVIIQNIPGAKLLSEVSAEIQYQLNMNDLPKFEKLFYDLDENKKKFKVQNYGIQITSLEEVFLKVADLTEESMNAQLLSAESQIIQRRQTQEDLNKYISKSKIGENNQQVNSNVADSDQTKVGQSMIDDFDMEEIRIKNQFCLHFFTLCWKRLIYFKRDIKGIVCEMVLPILILAAGLLLVSQSLIVNLPGQVLSPSIYDKQMPTNIQGSSYIQNKVELISQQFDQTNFQINNKFYGQEIPYEDQLNNFDNDNFQDINNTNRKGGYYFSNIQQNQYDYFLEVNTINKDALPIYINQMNNAIIRQATNQPDFNIQTTVSGLAIPQKIMKIEGLADGIVAAFIFSMALAFIPTSLIAFTVKEREDQVKHQQMVSGVSLKAYWLSNLFLDLSKYLFPTCIISILLVQLMNVSTFIDDNDVYIALILLFVLYGWAIITFSYAFGFIFKKYGNAQVTSFFLHFICGSTLTLVVFILRRIPSTQSVGDFLQWPLRLIPSFCFGNGVINLGSREFLSVLENSEQEPPLAYSLDIAGFDILFLFLDGLIYFCLIFILENLYQKGTIDRLVSKENNIKYTEKVLDDDVYNEQQRIQKTKPEEYNIRVHELRKVYKTPTGYNEAVDKISFGIQNGECFTLLGINGAGKTSTFKILSGDIQATSGEVHIQGYNVREDMKNARRYIGYCPQFDALIDKLTSREHLLLYCALKGIPKHMHKELVDQKIKEMDLSQFEHVQAGTYSGGNKRKLSVAIAMIGNPPIVFLDEPSTGIDPKARRYMWNLISKISTQRKRSSIILTTHSMEEAEALSTKIAIMVKGQLKCLGSIQHIKNKFGKGYELETMLQVVQPEEIQDKINEYGQDIFKLKLNEDNTIIINELQDLLKLLKSEHLYEEISEDGSGSSLHQALNSSRGLDLNILIEYIMIEQRGKELRNFLQENFSGFSIIEHFQLFYRFKIQTNVPTGKVFGDFEKNKDRLSIASYSIKQATIEQIFNMFAKDLIDTQEYNESQYQKQQSEETFIIKQNDTDSSINTQRGLLQSNVSFSQNSNNINNNNENISDQNNRKKTGNFVELELKDTNKQNLLENEQK